MRPSWIVSTILLFLLLSFCASADSDLLVNREVELPHGYQDNVWEYRYGRVVDIAFPTEGGQTITNFTFAPIGTYMMFTEQLPLCGDQQKLLNFSKADVIVVIMSKRMTRRFCHDLLRIDVIQDVRTAGVSNPFK